MAWHHEDSWATAALAPRLPTIIFTFVLALLLPILLHHFIYRKATPTELPTFLLIGPSGGGKTAFLTLVRFCWAWGGGGGGEGRALGFSSSGPTRTIETPDAR